MSFPLEWWKDQHLTRVTMKVGRRRKGGGRGREEEGKRGGGRRKGRER